MRKLVMNILLMLFIINYLFKMEPSNYVMRAPVTKEAVYSLSTCKGSHTITQLTPTPVCTK